MKNTNLDKEYVTMKLKIEKEHKEKAGQEAIEKKYENFYSYKTYKNEERVQLKKKINDEMFMRNKEWR